MFFYHFSDGDWRHANAGNMFPTWAVEVNDLYQEALQRFTQWPWIEHPTFQLRGRHSTTRYRRPSEIFVVNALVSRDVMMCS